MRLIAAVPDDAMRAVAAKAALSHLARDHRRMGDSDRRPVITGWHRTFVPASLRRPGSDAAPSGLRLAGWRCMLVVGGKVACRICLSHDPSSRAPVAHAIEHGAPLDDWVQALGQVEALSDIGDGQREPALLSVPDASTSALLLLPVPPPAVTLAWPLVQFGRAYASGLVTLEAFLAQCQ